MPWKGSVIYIVKLQLHLTLCNPVWLLYICTVEPRYNEVLGTMKITLLYQVSHYIRVKTQRNIKSWDQQNYLVIRGFCYICRPLYNEVPLFFILTLYLTEKKYVFIQYFVMGCLIGIILALIAWVVHLKRKKAKLKHKLENGGKESYLDNFLKSHT